jgi:hypothetical protein
MFIGNLVLLLPWGLMVSIDSIIIVEFWSRIDTICNYKKYKLRNSMGDELLNHCLMTFIEREVFLKVSDDGIVQTLA